MEYAIERDEKLIADLKLFAAQPTLLMAQMMAH